MELNELLPADQARFIESIATPVWPDLARIEETLERWGRSGAAVEGIGHSTEGREIKIARIGSGKKTLLAWGYPHPDEPIGAAALIALGDALLSGELRLEGWQAVFLLAADPDNLARNSWISRGIPYLEGCWRPGRLDSDVDYGFPIDSDVWDYPVTRAGRCRQINDCVGFCSELSGCLFADLFPEPLAESLLIKKLLERFEPELAATMHNTVIAGDYTFLLQREKPEVFRALLAAPEAVGSVRQLGERLDPGRRWKTKEPDLLKEYDLAYSRANLKRYPKAGPGAKFQGPAPVGLFIDRYHPGTQLLTPESALYRADVFSDRSETETRVRIKKTLHGQTLRRSFYHRGRWQLADQRPARPGDRSGQETIATPRSVFGTRALLDREEIVKQEELIWEGLSKRLKGSDHPYVLDRSRRDGVPGAGARRYFLSAADFRRPASKAQQATFELIWPVHSAIALGNFRTFLEAVGGPEAESAAEKLTELQEQALAGRKWPEADRAISLRSQLARLLIVLNAR